MDKIPSIKKQITNNTKITITNDPNNKSAAISRAWPRPLRGAILIPPTLLVVADLFCRHSQVTIMPYRVFQKMNVEHRIWIPA